MSQGFKYIDVTYLVEMSDGNKELMKEMIEIFHLQVSEFVDGLTKLYDERDYLNLGKLAHKAKSSVSIMGMESLADDLKILEKTAKAGIEQENYLPIITKFKNETNEAIGELNEFAEKL